MKSVIGYILLFILFGVIWEITPARTWFYQLKIWIESSFVMFRMTKTGQFMKRHNRVFHFAEDMFLFYFLFLWKDGLIFETARIYVTDFLEKHSFIGSFFSMVWSRVVWLSPFGRSMSQNADFRNPLIACSIITGAWLLFVIWVCFFSKDKNIVMGWLSIIFSIASWYLCFWACYLIQKAYVFNAVFGIILALIVAAAINCMVTAFIGIMTDDMA